MAVIGPAGYIPGSGKRNRDVGAGFNVLWRAGRIAGFVRTSSGHWYVTPVGGQQQYVGQLNQAEAYLQGWRHAVVAAKADR